MKHYQEFEQFWADLNFSPPGYARGGDIEEICKEIALQAWMAKGGVKGLKSHELKLAAKLLGLASQQFANHGCNDYDLVQDGGLTPEQAYEMNRAYHEFNGDLAEWSEEDLRATHAWAGDFGMMSYLAARLTQEAESDR